jgi:hypothetical protein
MNKVYNADALDGAGQQRSSEVPEWWRIEDSLVRNNKSNHREVGDIFVPGAQRSNRWMKWV